MPKTQAFFRAIYSWGKHHLRQRPIRLFLSLVVIITAVVLVKTSLVRALSKDFVQTDWSGGADVNATANDTHLTDWTKYYSKDTSVNTSTAGEVKLNLVSTP